MVFSPGRLNRPCHLRWTSIKSYFVLIGPFLATDECASDEWVTHAHCSCTITTMGSERYSINHFRLIYFVWDRGQSATRRSKSARNDVCLAEQWTHGKPTQMATAGILFGERQFYCIDGHFVRSTTWTNSEKWKIKSAPRTNECEHEINTKFAAKHRIFELAPNWCQRSANTQNIVWKCSNSKTKSNCKMYAKADERDDWPAHMKTESKLCRVKSWIWLRHRKSHPIKHFKLLDLVFSIES